MKRALLFLLAAFASPLVRGTRVRQLGTRGRRFGELRDHSQRHVREYTGFLSALDHAGHKRTFSFGWKYEHLYFGGRPVH